MKMFVLPPKPLSFNHGVEVPDLLNCLATFDVEAVQAICNTMAGYLQNKPGDGVQPNVGCHSLCAMFQKLRARVPDDHPIDWEAGGIFKATSSTLTPASVSTTLSCTARMSDVACMLAYVAKTHVAAPAASIKSDHVLKSEVLILVRDIDSSCRSLLSDFGLGDVVQELQ